MKINLPRVAAVHDMSCFGRCSLTVIIPILSAMGVQVCPLPTAVLSSHLGGFKDIAFYDFTDLMTGFFNHWQQEEISFDCIYSGFLASEQQIDIVSAFIDKFSGCNPIVLIDPVMGDDGKLYSIYTPHMQQQMKRLIRKADIITPNYTEACFLLEEEYQPININFDKIRNWLIRLADFGPSVVVMTGIHAGNKLLNIGYERKTNSFWEADTCHFPAKYPGTGDIFASVLAGSLLKGSSLAAAIKLSAGFVERCIETTFAAGTPTREGVLLESRLAWLADKCHNYTLKNES